MKLIVDDDNNDGDDDDGDEMEVPQDEAQHEGRIVLVEVDEEVKEVKPSTQVQFSLKYFLVKVKQSLLCLS